MCPRRRHRRLSPQYFAPTAQAIDGLEKALAGLLLQEALDLDLRKPQDYFHRIWATAFRAQDLAAAGHDRDDNHGDVDGVAETASA